MQRNVVPNRPEYYWELNFYISM